MLNWKTKLCSFVLVAGLMVPLAAMQSNRTVYKIGNGVTPPRLISKQEPDYTQAAKDAHIEGAVLLGVVIEADGRVSDVHVERGLDPGLDANAVEAIHEWVFKAAEKDGSPVAVSARVEVNFRLK